MRQKCRQGGAAGCSGMGATSKAKTQLLGQEGQQERQSCFLTSPIMPHTEGVHHLSCRPQTYRGSSPRFSRASTPTPFPKKGRENGWALHHCFPSFEGNRKRSKDDDASCNTKMETWRSLGFLGDWQALPVLILYPVTASSCSYPRAESECGG